MLIRIITAKIEATLRVASFVAGSLSIGFFINPTIPRLSGISEISVSIRKSIFGGYKFVNEIKRNEIVAKNPEIAIILKPNLRPLATIHVILPPNLSPSRSGISTPHVNNSCKKSRGRAKIRKRISNVPITTK